MANVDIKIRNNVYTITCNEDERGHILQLAKTIDSRLDGIEKTIGKVSDVMLLVINSVMVEDQLMQLQAQLAAVNPAAIEEKMLSALEEKLQHKTQVIITQIIDGIIAKLKELENILESS